MTLNSIQKSKINTLPKIVKSISALLKTVGWCNAKRMKTHMVEALHKQNLNGIPSSPNYMIKEKAN